MRSVYLLISVILAAPAVSLAPMNRTIICLAVLLLAGRISASAQDACGQPRSQDCSDAKLRHLRSAAGKLPNLAALLGGPARIEKERRFALAAPPGAEARARQWRLLDELLAGGNRLDPYGSGIRGKVGLLEPEQWYFVSILEDRRRSIYKDLGGGLAGNVAGNWGGAEGFLCFERSARLIREMKVVKDAGRKTFAGWSATDLGANLLRIGIPMTQRGEHHAPCFRLRQGKEVVEIVADPWADMIVPARVWWLEYDLDALEHIDRKAAASDGLCGQVYEEWNSTQRARVDKALDNGILGIVTDNARNLWKEENLGMEGLRKLIREWKSE